ncbi:MAG TPA: DUF348 domain-containing protein [Bacilli bacterium]|nr:DUF348 domain-containing protein [Bacilli bacterium]
MNLGSKLLPVLKNKIFISFMSVLTIIVVSYITYLEVTKAEIEFTHNDVTETFITREDTVGEFLTEQGIEVSPHDQLSHQLDVEIESGMNLSFKEAKAVVLTIDGVDEVHYTTEDTVKDFFAAIDLTVSEHDQLNLALNQAIVEELAIVLDRAVEVTINDRAEEESLWTTEKTVADLLAAQSIELTELDRLEPKEDVALEADMVVTITRVEEVTDVVEETIDFSTVRRNDSSIEKGKETVVSAGSAGLVEKKFKVTLENGEEVSRELISEEVKKESEQRVVAVGTKEIAKVVSRGGSSSGGSKSFTMSSTAYTAGCSGCSGVTATGINLKDNPHMKVIAVDPSLIPLGTRVYVEGYGEAVAGDTGGSIKGKKIDVHVPTKSDAYNWGKRSVKVTILD